MNTTRTNPTRKYFAALAAVSLALAVSACERAGEPEPAALAWNGVPAQTVVPSGPIVQQGTIRDPSLPDAATVFAAEEAAEKAREQAAAAHQAATLPPQLTVAPVGDAVAVPPAATEKPAVEQADSSPASAAEKTKLN